MTASLFLFVNGLEQGLKGFLPFFRGLKLLFFVGSPFPVPERRGRHHPRDGEASSHQKILGTGPSGPVIFFPQRFWQSSLGPVGERRSG